MADNEVKMMMSVYPGAMTGFAALNAGLVSINNVFGNVMRAFDRQFDLLDTAITTTGVVVTQLGIDAMNAFGEFEQGMKIVQMVSGQTAQDIGYLSQKANEFSVQYRTDIDQITEGLQTLGRAGLNSATEQTEVLQNGLNTAKLEGRDLNSVLEELIQNTALLGGNLKSSDFGEESEYVNDLLVATSMTAPITTHDVSETLKYSGGIAAAAGANIESDSGKAILEDYMGTIAAFAQKGVTGSIAGTALRAFFNKPATQDSSVKDALASIKLKPEYLWEDDEEVMKPVSEQIKLIQDQMDDLNVSTMDRLQIWSKIVGGKMGQQMMKLDSSDIKELTKDIRAADDASDLAAGSMKTYQANVKALGESGAALQRDVGEKLVYFVNPILEFMNKFTVFLDNDISASVLATSIIAFVGMLGKKIFDVIKIVKGELSTLMSGLKYNLGSKPGFAIGPNGEIIQKDETKGKGPKSLHDLAKQYYGFQGNSEMERLKNSGYSTADMARIGMFSKLTKDSTGLGISDADFVKKIYPGLSSDFKTQIDKALKTAGGGSRTPFNQLFLDSNKELKEEFLELYLSMEKTEKGATGATAGLESVSNASKETASALKLLSNRLSLNDKNYSYGFKKITPQQITNPMSHPNIPYNVLKDGVNKGGSSLTYSQQYIPTVFPNIPHDVLKKGMTAASPLTYSQNLSLLFGEQYGNVEAARWKGYTPLTGQIPWFMQFNTPRDLFKNGPTQFSYVSNEDSVIAAEQVRAAKAARKSEEIRTESLRKQAEKNVPVYSPKTLYPVVKVPTGEHPVENMNTTLSAYGIRSSRLDGIRSKFQGFGIQESNFYKNLQTRLDADRSGRFLSFGSTTVNGVTRSATKGLSGLANKALNLSDAFGGPLMIAIMAVTTAIQMWQQAFQDYCEDLKEAGNKLKDAYSEWESAESSLRNSYAEENPDATDEELDQKIYDTYDTMGDVMREAVTYGDDTAWLNKINTDAVKQPTYEYDQEADDGSVKIAEEQIDTETKLQESIKQNTGALYQATSEVSMALDNYVRQGTDSWWGINGWTGQLTDIFGAISDLKDWWRVFNPTQWPALIADIFENQINDNRFSSNRSKFMDEQEFLLTARQKDENYAGNTEMAGLMLQDFKDAGGNWLAGMQTMMGDDAITFSHLISDEAKTFLDAEAKFASRLTQGQNLKIQTSMKNDSKTWKQLAKEIVKNEMKTGRKTTKQNQTKKIEGLINKLNRSMGNQFSHTQLLQAAYLQIMQGMLEVAKTTIVPIIAENAQIAAQTMYNSGGIDQKANQSNSTTSGIGAINSSIAAMVSQIAMAKSAEATYNGILMQDPTKLSGGDLAAYKLAQESTDAQDFLKKAANASYNGASLSVDWGKALGGAFEGVGFGASGAIAGFSKGVSYQSAKDNQKAMDDILTNFGMTALMQVYQYDAKTAQDKVTQAIAEWRKSGASSQQIYESLAQNYQNERFYKQLNNAYVNSGGDEGESSGGGSGSGSGSGDKDNNTGTRRERVDLVLCNKKEIPKLNVNLFKKPPSFTILNKNFKLRDVKINSEDKPKAIMAAIKNSFIDIQKRTDPKIIQDEDAVYDPKAATDGTNVPSGSAKTKTDNNS